MSSNSIYQEISRLPTWFFRSLFLTLFLHSSLFATCSTENNQSFNLNEFNTKDRWFELYANPNNLKTPITNWSVDIRAVGKSQTKTFDFNVSKGSYYIIIDNLTTFPNNTDLKNNPLDVVIKDGSGNIIDYFNLGLAGAYLAVPADVTACGLDIPCNTFNRANNGERDYMRDPDGSCTLTANTWKNDTSGVTNNGGGTVPTISINNITQNEGTGVAGTFTEFNFTVSLTGTHTSDIYVSYRTIDGSAVAASDYESKTGVLTFDANTTNPTAIITVRVAADSDVEADENFFVNLDAATFGTFTVQQGIGTILNDDSNAKTGLFNAVDSIGAGCDALSDWDNNITTQIVNKSNDFWILAKDTLGANLEANITKITLVHYDNGGNTACSGSSTLQEVLCTDCGLTDANGCLSKSISASRALKCVEVLIEGKDANSASAVVSESNASDNFSVRPDRYNLILSSSSYYAGHDFNTTAHAYDFNGVDTNDYNETQAGGSFVIDANETRLDCITIDENLTITDADFSNGVTSALNTVFYGLAEDLTVKIHEVLGSEFSLVDSDDTSDILRLITPYEVNLTVLPYELNVSQTSITSSTGMDWIYMADVYDMNITASATVKANNKQHFTLVDFNATCYAKDVNLSFGMTSNGDPLLDMNYTAAEGTFSDGTLVKNQELQDINQSMTIPANDFTNGTANASMAFNVDRNFSNPINPFYVNGIDSNITTTYVALIQNPSSADTNISLYYGRLRGNDIITTLSPVSNPIYFEVYDTTGSIYTQGMDQTSLSWYINNLHTGITPGNIIEANASTNTIIDNVVAGFAFSYVPVSTGVEPLGITSTVPKATIHLKTQPWLWYAPDGFGSDYNDNAGSDCTMHPCFQYTYSSNNNALIIQSGDFNGSLIPDQNRSNYQRKGVKLFR